MQANGGRYLRRRERRLLMPLISYQSEISNWECNDGVLKDHRCLSIPNESNTEKETTLV